MSAMFANQSGQNEQSLEDPSIDASYQVSVHLAKWFQRRRFLKIGQSERRIACGGYVCKWIGTKWAIFIEDFPEGFQRRRFKCEKLMDDRQRTLFLVMEVGAHRSTYHDQQSYQYEHILLYGFREVVFTISYYVTQCIK